MEKLDRDAVFARLPRMDATPAAEPAEPDALLQLLLPLLEAEAKGEEAGAAPAGPEDGLPDSHFGAGDAGAPGMGTQGGAPVLSSDDLAARGPAPLPGLPIGFPIDFPGSPGSGLPGAPEGPEGSGGPEGPMSGPDAAQTPDALDSASTPHEAGPLDAPLDGSGRSSAPSRSVPDRAGPPTPRVGAQPAPLADIVADKDAAATPRGRGPSREWGPLAQAAAAAEARTAAAAPLGGWGGDMPDGLGQRMTVGLAGLAADSVDARRQVLSGTGRSRSDLENLEPVALGAQQRRTLQSPGMPAAMQPVVAQIAADMYRMQTARLDQLMASRAADEDGEPPPVDAEEALQRQREIKGVDLGGMWRWDLTPRIPTAPGEEPTALHLPFRAALLTVTMQDPAAVLPLFAREGLRLYVPGGDRTLQPHWEPALLAPHAPLSWMGAAERAFVRAYPHGDVREALQALLGRAAMTETVVGDHASAKRLWQQLCCANSPRQVPTVLRTLEVEGIPLAAGHAYGVLGTFVRDSDWMVTLCDPLAALDRNVFAVPFSSIRRSADTLTVSARA